MAVFALLLQALIPLGQAVAAPTDGSAPAFRIVCTAFGLQSIPNSGKRNEGGKSNSYSCPICQIHAFSLVLPEIAQLPLPALHAAIGADRTAAPVRESRDHGPAFPRGPPLLLV